MFERGLVKVTIDAPERRMDLTLPENCTPAEVLPSILRHAGGELGDEGAENGGWLLRRPDGDPLEPARSLAGQAVRDGELLLLVPAEQRWPELEYDDVADAIAVGARRTGREWTADATRWAGVGLGTALLLGALAVRISGGPPWPAIWPFAFALAATGIVAAVLLTHACGDPAAGTTIGLLAAGCAAAGGALVLAGNRPLTELGAPHLLTAGAATAVAGVALATLLEPHRWVFVALATAGAGAVAGGLLDSGGAGPDRTAGILGAVSLALLPAVGPAAIRLGRLPRPALPRSTADLLADPPQPPRPAVAAAARRAAAWFGGLLAGLAATLAVTTAVLGLSQSTAGRLLAAAAAATCLLRARLLTVVAHRLALLLAGLSGATALLVGHPVPATSVRLAVAAGALIALGQWYARHRASAYLGRFAELAEGMTTLAVVPLLMSLLGLYGYVRGFGG